MYITTNLKWSYASSRVKSEMKPCLYTWFGESSTFEVDGEWEAEAELQKAKLGVQ